MSRDNIHILLNLYDCYTKNKMCSENYNNFRNIIVAMLFNLPSESKQKSKFGLPNGLKVDILGCCLFAIMLHER